MFPQARFHEISQPQAERLGCPHTVTGILMLRWFHALMPKEERFFDLFARHSDAVLAGAQAAARGLPGQLRDARADGRLRAGGPGARRLQSPELRRGGGGVAAPARNRCAPVNSR